METAGQGFPATLVSAHPCESNSQPCEGRTVSPPPSTRPPNLSVPNFFIMIPRVFLSLDVSPSSYLLLLTSHLPLSLFRTLDFCLCFPPILVQFFPPLYPASSLPSSLLPCLPLASFLPHSPASPHWEGCSWYKHVGSEARLLDMAKVGSEHIGWLISGKSPNRYGLSFPSVKWG